MHDPRQSSFHGGPGTPDLETALELCGCRASIFSVSWSSSGRLILTTIIIEYSVQLFLLVVLYNVKGWQSPVPWGE